MKKISFFMLLILLSMQTTQPFVPIDKTPDGVQGTFLIDGYVPGEYLLSASTVGASQYSTFDITDPETGLGTLVENPTDDIRVFGIYLPPNYDAGQEYPVLYWLPGAGQTPFVSVFDALSSLEGYEGVLTLPELDNLITSEQIKPYIVVFPDLRTAKNDPILDLFLVLGTNSDLMGNWEDYLVFDLRSYINQNYQTKTDRASTYLFGISRGGNAAQYLGVKYPDVYNGIALWEPAVNAEVINLNGSTAFQVTFDQIVAFAALENGGRLNPFNPLVGPMVNTAANFSYNPNLPPYFLDIPYKWTDVNFDGYLLEFDEFGNVIRDEEVIERWNEFTLAQLVKDPEYSEPLRKKRLFVGMPAADQVLPPLGTQLLSNALTEQGIDHQLNIVNFCTNLSQDECDEDGGGHLIYVAGVSPLNPCCQLTPRAASPAVYSSIYKQVSAWIARGDECVEQELVRIYGDGVITLEDNAQFVIGHGTFVGVVTNPESGVDETYLQLTLNDDAQFIIDGGAFQVGNDFGKVLTEFDDPSLQDNEIRLRLRLEDVGTKVTIGQQGFLGFGVGLDGKACPEPNFWSINSLDNVKYVTVELERGSFCHQQSYEGDSTCASLFAISCDDETRYDFEFNQKCTRVLGGGNLIKVKDARWVHPTVQDEAGQLPPELIRSAEFLLTEDDFPYENNAFFPTNTLTHNIAYTDERSVGIMGSKPVLNDRNKPSQPFNATGQELFDFLKTPEFYTQDKPQANIAQNECDEVEECIVSYVCEDELYRTPVAEVSCSKERALNVGAVCLELTLECEVVEDSVTNCN